MGKSGVGDDDRKRHAHARRDGPELAACRTVSLRRSTGITILVHLTSRYGDLDVGRINVAIECDTQLVAVEFTLPPGYDDASDTVAA